MRIDTPVEHTGTIVNDDTVHLLGFFLMENNIQMALKPACYFNLSTYINNIWTDIHITLTYCKLMT